jgi:hypothetical protein
MMRGGHKLEEGEGGRHKLKEARKEERKKGHL